MKICCIDVGTNSVLCLLAIVDSKQRLRPIEFYAETTRLGKSLHKNKTLSIEPQNKTLKTIKNLLTNTKADKYILVGTSALREAKNSKAFINKVYLKTGYKIKVLSEDQEAKLAFDSVNHFIKPIPKNTLITDIGGGSTEFIFCKNGKIIKKTSIPIGAVNITEKFKNNINDASNFIRSSLHKKLQKSNKFQLITIGGTTTTLGAILKRLETYNPKKIHGITVSLNKTLNTLCKLKSMPLNRRKKLLSFDPKRADIIIGGLCILKTIMEEVKTKNFKICEKGLVYALALNYKAYSTIKAEAPSAGK
jgi:exopolyphosphatase/guanosine-5'-triphosphate,3'-diphosphate pyrophosphatase